MATLPCNFESAGCAKVAYAVAAQHNQTLKAFRNRLVADGKPKKLAIIAAARKLLTILNAILRANRPWQPQNT